MGERRYCGGSYSPADCGPGIAPGRLSATILALCALACGRSADEASSPALHAIDSIALEESADDPIEAVTAVATSDDGAFLVVDGPAGRIRRFDAAGRRAGVAGRPGDGPGELSDPTYVAISGDSLLVAERGSPRLTVFAGDTLVRVARVPGQYGFWIADHGATLLLGAATEDARFAVTDRDGEPRATFGTRAAAVRETPYWVFFVRERAVRIGDRIAVSSSFSPAIRLFDAAGDSIGEFGDAPPSWIPPTAPPSLQGIDRAAQRGIIADWSRSFTVVTQLAVVDDTLLVVGYGHHDPTPTDPYAVVHETLDIYTPAGDKLVEGLPFTDAIVGGGRFLLVVTASPPGFWTLTRMAYGHTARSP